MLLEKIIFDIIEIIGEKNHYNNLLKIKIENENLTRIQNDTFLNMNNLEVIEILNVENIDRLTFKNLINLKNLTIFTKTKAFHIYQRKFSKDLFFYNT